MNSNQILRKIGAIFVLFVITGCHQSPVIPTNTALPPGKWLKDFLSAPLCSPPCWENIVPGFTKMEDALHIIESRTDSSDLKTYSEDNRLREIGWAFQDDKSGAFLQAELTGDLVMAIHFYPGGLQLSSIIDKYGEPNLIDIEPTEMINQKTTYILFKSQKMVLEIPVMNTNQTIVIDAKIIVARISLYNDESFANYLPGTSKNVSSINIISNWQGYGSYQVNNQ